MIHLETRKLFEGTLVGDSRGTSTEKRGHLMNDIDILDGENLRSNKVSAIKDV